MFRSRIQNIEHQKFMFPIPNYPKKRKMLLPCIDIKPDDDIKKSFNWKIKVSVRCTEVVKIVWSRKWVNNACSRAEWQ